MQCFDDEDLGDEDDNEDDGGDDLEGGVGAAHVPLRGRAASLYLRSKFGSDHTYHQYIHYDYDISYTLTPRIHYSFSCSVVRKKLANTLSTG